MHRSAFWLTVVKRGECLIQTAGWPQSSGHVWVNIEGERIYAHRFAYRELVAPLIKGKVIRHSCDVPACVNPSHLLQGTQRENVNDMFERLGKRVGLKNGQARLTEAQVQQIRDWPKGWKNALKAAEKFKISWTHVYQIKRGARRSVNPDQGNHKERKSV